MVKLSLHNVTKDFGAVTAVRNVTLDVEPGEFLVLVGPSGCGKTTLLRLVAGLEDLTSGQICMDDQPIDHLPPKNRNVAMVFQDYALYPHMTVFKNMAFALEARRMSREAIRSRVEEVARTIGLEELLDRRPAELSGGQRQRVAMGRAIVRNPQAFLFDEPLSNLDAKLRVHMRTEIRALCKRLGTTALYVTHDQVEAMTMADRIVIMNKGTIQQVGSPETVYRTPANRFVASFIGSPAMNFLHGRAQKRADGWELMAANTRLELPPSMGERIGEKDIWLAFRPEAVSLGQTGERGLQINGRVFASELMGRERALVVETGFGMINVIVAGEAVVSGNVTLTVAGKDVHLFRE